MKFVSRNLTKEHLQKSPHRWIAACILSPIHAAELYYKRRYHITYIHAKKLFFFDMLLVIGMIGLLGMTIFWFTFDPTVTQYVSLSIQTHTHDDANTDMRVRSGEHLEYTVTYANNSDVTLTNVLLRMQLPEGFIVEDGTRNVPLPDLLPGDSGAVKLAGFFYEDHEGEHHISAILRYTQEGRSFEEQRLSTVIQTLRGSIVVPEITLPENIVAQGSVPFTLTLTNDDHHTQEEVRVPFPAAPYSLTISTVSKGDIESGAWVLRNMRPREQVTLTGTLRTNLTTRDPSALFEITPLLYIDGREIRQQPAQHTFTILRPEATASAVWSSQEPLSPGSARPLTLTVQNVGTISLTNPAIQFEIPSTVEASGLLQANGGTISQNTYTLVVTETLAPGASTVQELSIPVKTRMINGTDVSLELSPRITASLSGLTGNAYQSQPFEISPLAIGTNAFLYASIRYYTDEGDQLGRGPLPAQVGQETKYWAFISFQNTTSRIINLSFSADLTESAQWTGKSSVSHGQGMFYNREAHRVTWNHTVLGPHETLGLFMELGMIPTAAQIGTSPALLDNIRISGEDGYTNLPISRTFGPIDITLPDDELGQARGTVVIQ